MTEGTTRVSYKERLAGIGSLIDDEIENMVKREVEAALARFKQSQSSDQNLQDRRPQPTESEIEEALLLVEAQSDQNSILEFLALKPDLLSNYQIFRVADDNLRSYILRRLSDCHLKMLFKSCCESGDSDSSSAIILEWRLRLVNFEDRNCEPCPILMIRSGNIEGIEKLFESGLNISVESREGNNIVHEAIQTRDARVVESVLHHIPVESMGEYLSKRNLEGKSAMEMEASDGIKDLVQSHWLVVLSLEGNQCYKEGRFDEAVEKYKEAVTLCETIPGDSKAENIVKLEYNCGRALFRRGCFVDCIQHCVRCIEIDPSYLNAYSQIAQAKIELLDYAGAKKDYETLVTMLTSKGSIEPPSRQVNEIRLKLLEIDQILRTDHYTILGIDKFFTDEQKIKSAYRQLARRFHPDKVMGESEDVRARCRNQFARIQTAYEILSGPSKEEYDLNLRIQLGTEAVRQSLLLRRRQSCESSPPTSPVIRQMRMRQFLGSEGKSPGDVSRSFDVLYRN